MKQFQQENSLSLLFPHFLISQCLVEREQREVGRMRKDLLRIIGDPSLYFLPIHFPYFRSQHLNTVCSGSRGAGKEKRMKEYVLSSPEELDCSSDGHSSSSAASGSCGLRRGQQHPSTTLWHPSTISNNTPLLPYYSVPQLYYSQIQRSQCLHAKTLLYSTMTPPYNTLF